MQHIEKPARQQVNQEKVRRENAAFTKLDKCCYLETVAAAVFTNALPSSFIAGEAGRQTGRSRKRGVRSRQATSG
jgi:hypothetical protein